MIPLIEAHRTELESLCRNFAVKKLELFGSSTQDRFNDDESDLDFLVQFPELPPMKHAQAYFGLLECLQDLFTRRIDLVEANAIQNPYLTASINQNKVLLYAA